VLDSYAVALLLGLVAGLRTLTAPAVLWLAHHRSPAAYVLGVFALFELAVDLYPKAPARTGFAGLSARLISGAFCGWVVTASAGRPAAAGAALGAVGAAIGAFGGLAARTRAIGAIGRVPAALLEDAIAIAGAIAVVM
jgi:uncharacterized membrane protein